MAAWAPTLAALQQRLCDINPYQGANPEGNCVACSREAARVLTTAAMPTAVSDDDDPLPNLSSQTPIVFHPAPNRAQAILGWLQGQAGPGVYVVDGGEDHNWNFVITTNRRVWLIDSNQHRFVRVQALPDLQGIVHNETLQDAVAMDYGNDPPNERFDITLAGPLAPAFDAMLSA